MTIMWQNLQGIMLRWKSILKGYTLYDSSYITYLEWQNFRNGGQITDCWQLGMKVGIGWGEWGYKRANGILVVIQLFSILTVVLDTVMLICDKIIQN